MTRERPRVKISGISRETSIEWFGHFPSGMLWWALTSAARTIVPLLFAWGNRRGGAVGG